MKFEFYIQGHDMPDNEKHKRLRLGDIVAVRPYPWNWGLKEIKYGLILIVNVPWSLNPMPDFQSLTKIQIARFLIKTKIWFRLKITPRETVDDVLARFNSMPLANAKSLIIQAWKAHEQDKLDSFIQSRLYDKGIHNSEILDIDPGDPNLSLMKSIYQDPVICTNLDMNEASLVDGKIWRNRPAVLAKRKFRLPVARLLNRIPEIDIDKIQDSNYIYQPFKSASQLIQKFDGRNSNHSLSINEVDYSIPGTIDSEEIIEFNWIRTTNPIPKDKWNDSDVDPEENPPPALDVD